MLIGVLFVLGGTVSASEFTDVEWTEVYEMEREMNPLYEGLVSPTEEAPQALAGEESFTGDEALTALVTYRTSLALAAADLRAGMVAREASITVGFQTQETYNDKELCTIIFQKAFTHTGDPDEGDYLAWHWKDWDVSMRKGTSGAAKLYQITYTISYYTSAYQEQSVAVRTKTILDSLHLYDKSDYEKVRGIYNYICSNVKYGTPSPNLNGYMQYTCYSAILNNKAVCQGYASMYYRLALELGLDTRIIFGKSGSVPHVWMIVRLGDLWFYLDPTWDAGKTSYNYFLKGESDFPGHVRQDNPPCSIYYTYTSFYAAYPVARTAYNPISVPGEREFGVCGSGVFWELETDGCLVIYGSGATWDYTSPASTPWNAYASSIREVYIDHGITRLGNNALRNCTAVTLVYLPDTLTEIGTNAIPVNGASARAMKVKIVVKAGTGWFIANRRDGRHFLISKEDFNMGITEFTEKFSDGTGTTPNLFRLISADGKDIYSYPTTVTFGMRFQRVNETGGVTDEVTLVRWGDMNADGKVDRQDATDLLWSFMKPDSYKHILRYDLNGDGVTNASDAAYLLTIVQ